MEWERLTEKKALLDKLGPSKKELLQNLEDWFRVELTYTSNAIEGNTLTRQETAVVVEKGISVGGKSVTEILEAKNHALALDWLKENSNKPARRISGQDILKIHELLLTGIDETNAGRYRSIPVRVAGSLVVFPNALKVPDRMTELIRWLQTEKDLHPAELAAQAHYKLVTIHPFVDGNGRTARLLMNLILMRMGYPPAVIRKENRLVYIKSLEKGQLGGSLEDYEKIIFKAVHRSLDIYIEAAQSKKGTQSKKEIQRKSKSVIRIGELAKKTNETNSTIRHWTKMGLLKVADTTPSGFQLYSTEMIGQIKKIKQLKQERYTLSEIAEMLKKD